MPSTRTARYHGLACLDRPSRRAEGLVRKGKRRRRHRLDERNHRGYGTGQRFLIPRFVRRHAVDGLERESHPTTVIERPDEGGHRQRRRQGPDNEGLRCGRRHIRAARRRQSIAFTKTRRPSRRVNRLARPGENPPARFSASATRPPTSASMATRVDSGTSFQRRRALLADITVRPRLRRQDRRMTRLSPRPCPLHLFAYCTHSYRPLRRPPLTSLTQLTPRHHSPPEITPARTTQLPKARPARITHLPQAPRDSHSPADAAGGPPHAPPTRHHTHIATTAQITTTGEQSR